jgi:hypothetical protein
MEWFSTEAGAALLVLAQVVVFGALVWAKAARLQRGDAERQQATVMMTISGV